MWESKAKISKSSKVIGESHCNRWSDIAETLAFLIHFPNLAMASFDVKSIFTSTPFVETNGLCVENLYRNQTHTDSLWKVSFRRLLEMIMFEYFLNFIKNITNNVMMLWWVPQWDAHWLMSFCAILRNLSNLVQACCVQKIRRRHIFSFSFNRSWRKI